MSSTLTPPKSLQHYLREIGSLIESCLDRSIVARDCPQKAIFEAARYALLGPGKRIRPVLALTVIDALGGSIEEGVEACCALEMIHASSLIHDDLPCMDNDDFRRGRPTLHKVYPEGQAVLTGWHLVAQAFETLCTVPHLTNAQRVELVQVLAHSSGGEGLAAGQWLDLDYEGKQADLETLQYIHRHKTGAIIEGSIQFGLIIGEANETQGKALLKYAQEVGLAFQVVDDILDVTQSVKKHGHQVASDINKQKSTYVALLGLEGAQKEAERLLDSAIHTLEGVVGLEPYWLKELARMIVHRDQ